jgi:hypothetical protein
MMDRMLNIPMARLVDFVPLDPRIQEALLGSPKGVGRALQLCRFHERGGDVEGLFHSDALVRDSALNYFNALLSAGNSLHALAV